jgi:hypothetical protein
MPNSHPLKILHWNCNGITSKTNELHALLFKFKIDIVLLGETKLNPNNKLKIPNYFTYRTDNAARPRLPSHGGTAVLVHRRVVHRQVYINTSINSTSIEISLGNEYVRISSVYKPPGQPLVIDDIQALSNGCDWYVIAGDLNAKHPLWHSRHANTAGIILYQHVQQNDYSIVAPVTPTFYPNNHNHRPDVLDIALVKLPQLLTEVYNLNDLSSDHNPILLHISDSPVKTFPPASTLKVNWIKVRLELEQKFKNLNLKMNTTHSIDEAISLFTSKIQSAVQNNTFLNQSKNPFKLPPEIAQEISAKNRLRHNWQRTHDPAIKRQLNHKIAFIRLVLRTHKQDEWDKFMTTLDTNDNSIFKLNKKLLNKAPASHPLSGPTGLIYSAADKAELFADIFQTQFSPNPGPDLPEVNTNIQTIRHTPILNSLFISPGTLAQYIKRLPNRKAPGQDTISNAALKNIPPKGIVMLTNIFNGCLRLGYFPSAWKTGIIITIPKAGKDHNLPVNHRPITLLSSVSKLLERVVLKFLLDAVGRKIRHEQFAFRSNHSTSLQLVNVIDHLCLKANNKEKTAAVFLDVEKAFDRVWHDGLLHKLHVLGTPIQITKMVDSFLGNRFFTVRNDNCFSSTRPILAGVPQGSCLSPSYTPFTPTTFP